MQNIKTIKDKIALLQKTIDEIEESTTYYQVVFDNDYYEMEGKGNPKLHGKLFETEEEAQQEINDKLYDNAYQKIEKAKIKKVRDGDWVNQQQHRGEDEWVVIIDQYAAYETGIKEVGWTAEKVRKAILEHEIDLLYQITFDDWEYDNHYSIEEVPLEE